MPRFKMKMNWLLVRRIEQKIPLFYAWTVIIVDLLIDHWTLYSGSWESNPPTHPPHTHTHPHIKLLLWSHKKYKLLNYLFIIDEGLMLSANILWVGILSEVVKLCDGKIIVRELSYNTRGLNAAITENCVKWSQFFPNIKVFKLVRKYDHSKKNKQLLYAGNGALTNKCKL